jgi:hypothetical protein
MTIEDDLRMRAAQYDAEADRLEADDLDHTAIAARLAHPGAYVTLDPLRAVARHRDVVDAVTVLRATADLLEAEADAL